MTADRPTAAVAAIVVLCLGAAAWQLVHLVRVDHRAVSGLSGSLEQRDLSPTDDFGLRPIATAAQDVLPRNARYTIVVGTNPPELDPLTAQAIYSIVPGALFPRRYTPDIHAARWVILFHGSSESLGVRVLREIGLGPDGNAVEIAP